MVELKIEQPQNIIAPNNAVYALYQRYGALLLGYITEVVKDKNLAEQYLIAVFKEVMGKADDFTLAESCWVKLQQQAKKVLSTFNQSVQANGVTTNTRSSVSNTYLNLMERDQYQVFCGLHYQQKTVAVLAKELNKTEESIKQLLRSALTIIRNEQKR
jgi:DNA-directed RNA polymerase sigma subunit (sigma70/sigma32)